VRVIPVIDLKGGQVVRAVAGSVMPMLRFRASLCRRPRRPMSLKHLLQGSPRPKSMLRISTPCKAALPTMKLFTQSWLRRAGLAGSGVQSEGDLQTLHAAIRGAEKQTSVILASESIKGAAALSLSYARWTWNEPFLVWT